MQPRFALQADRISVRRPTDRNAVRNTVLLQPCLGVSLGSVLGEWFRFAFVFSAHYPGQMAADGRGPLWLVHCGTIQRHRQRHFRGP